MNSSVFEYNRSASGGGAIYCTLVENVPLEYINHLELDDCKFFWNEASDPGVATFYSAGGAVCCAKTGLNVKDGCEFGYNAVSGNQPIKVIGGAIALLASSAVIDDAKFYSNRVNKNDCSGSQDESPYIAGGGAIGSFGYFHYQGGNWFDGKGNSGHVTILVNDRSKEIYIKDSVFDENVLNVSDENHAGGSALYAFESPTCHVFNSEFRSNEIDIEPCNGDNIAEALTGGVIVLDSLRA